MIHINRGDGKHEILTSEEFKEKYPELHAAQNAPRPYKEQGQALKRIRQAADMTQREMAKAVGIPLGELSAMEHGRTEPTSRIQEAYRDIEQLVASTRCDNADGECCGSCADLAQSTEEQP